MTTHGVTPRENTVISSLYRVWDKPIIDLTPPAVSVLSAAEAVGEICARPNLTQAEINTLYTIHFAVSQRLLVEDSKHQ